jgi:hypothetical protein
LRRDEDGRSNVRYKISPFNGLVACSRNSGKTTERYYKEDDSRNGIKRGQKEEPNDPDRDTNPR